VRARPAGPYIGFFDAWVFNFRMVAAAGHFQHGSRIMTLSDAEADTLRSLLGDIDRELVALFGPVPAEGAPHSHALRASWKRLMGALALGPAPELRECPVCHHGCRIAATLCGSCWTKLTPVDSANASRA
jgi:hypothetical protein